MTKRISTLEVRFHLGELLNRVSLRDDQYVIERRGKPLAAVVPIWQFENMQQRRERFFRKIDEVRSRNRNVPLEKIEAEVAQAVRAVRKRGRVAKGRH